MHFSARSSFVSIRFSKGSISPKCLLFTDLQNQKARSSLLPRLMWRGVGGEMEQGKHINHQDLKKLSPRNALVLDSKHIFFHQVNISKKCSQALSVQEKEKKLGARLKK